MTEANNENKQTNPNLRIDIEMQEKIEFTKKTETENQTNSLKFESVNISGINNNKDETCKHVCFLFWLNTFFGCFGYIYFCFNYKKIIKKCTVFIIGFIPMLFWLGVILVLTLYVAAIASVYGK